MSRDAAGQTTPAEILGASLTEVQARDIYRQGEEAVVFALLTFARKLGELQPDRATPTTPSGMIPPYQKPPATRRRKRPGRKAGHPGSHRPPPERIDHRQEHRLPRCPHCGGRLRRCTDTRTRYIEDIPQGIQPVVTEHVIHRDWCPHCRKQVEPVVPDALSGSTLGNRTLVLSAWLHYGLGNTLSQIVDVFNYHLQLTAHSGRSGADVVSAARGALPLVSAIAGGGPGLGGAARRRDLVARRRQDALAVVLCQRGGDLLPDRPLARRTGVAEILHRGVPRDAGYRFLGSVQRGGLCCAAGLPGAFAAQTWKRWIVMDEAERHWPAFAKKLRRLVGDAIRLWRQEGLSSETFASRRQRLDERLDELIETPWEDGQARRLIKRLRRHRDDLFTFLDRPGVPFDNNLGERAIRPAVIIRKNSYSNRSQRGADAQAVFMSIYRTLKQRGHDPLTTITEAIETYLSTGQLPELPQITSVR